MEQEISVVPSSKRELLNAFATYLRRVITSAGDSGDVITADRGRNLLSSTTIGVVAKKHSIWTRKQIKRRSGLIRQFSGISSVGATGLERFPVEIFDHWDRSQVLRASPSFDVLAIVYTFNEADIIDCTIKHLLANGVRVHVIDNWSTDDTPDIVADLVTRYTGQVELERFPVAGPPEVFELESVLTRAEVVAHESGADWVILNDADELRESPWSDASIVDALWMIEGWGYNCVDHTIINFRPIDDLWRNGGDLSVFFPWCEFGDASGHFTKLGTWKPQATPVQLASSGGHQAIFEGRRVFPYKFLVRHYPIRSQSHGERKVFQERRPRWSPVERAKGWHVHYDHYNVDTSFIWDPAGLFRWDELDHHFLLQRLSGVGLAGNPWPHEGGRPSQTA
jgi:hypothetical protein